MTMCSMVDIGPYGPNLRRKECKAKSRNKFKLKINYENLKEFEYSYNFKHSQKAPQNEI